MSQIEIESAEILVRIPALVRVAETKNLSEAARQLGVSPSAISKSISRLEESLGLRLFHRTTRHIALTEEGRLFYERCRQILADVDEASSQALRSRSEPEGTIRASVPMGIGRLLLVPALPRLQKQYPRMNVELELTDRVVDVIGEGLDVAIRIGSEPSHSQGRVARRSLGQSSGVVCASPRYLERHGQPSSPSDLESRNIYLYGSLHQEPFRTWEFRKGDETCSVSVDGGITLDSGEALVDLAKQGEGIIGVFDFLARPAFDQGELKRILPEWELWSVLPITAAFPKHRRLSAKVMAFLEFAEEVIRD